MINILTLVGYACHTRQYPAPSFQPLVDTAVPFDIDWTGLYLKQSCNQPEAKTYFKYIIRDLNGGCR